MMVFNGYDGAMNDGDEVIVFYILYLFVYDRIRYDTLIS